MDPREDTMNYVDHNLIHLVKNNIYSYDVDY